MAVKWTDAQRAKFKATMAKKRQVDRVVARAKAKAKATPPAPPVAPDLLRQIKAEIATLQTVLAYLQRRR